MASDGSTILRVMSNDFFLPADKTRLGLIGCLLNRRILLFPQGNNDRDQVAVYLDSAESREQEPNWHVCAQFALLMSNPHDPTVYTMHGSFYNSDVIRR